ncbi:MAG: DUF4382 domain-containing protein [Chloroflexi bacterium]|nr:DUF4382 domain-containing protein [Chloroflexota bacterium]MCL5949765.1 DUF4382 domain-containing protein [Candidatus Bathyarchaeota archaeon]
MAINTKKLSIYVIAGIAAAIIIIAAISTSGVHLPSNTQNPVTLGTLTVSIKDAPVQLSKLEVTIDSIEVQSQNNSWINLPFIDGTQTVHVDLLTLQDISQDLSTTSLPTGNYTNIRLHVKDATATFQDGSVVNLNVPSDKIDIIVHFQIKEDATTKVLIDMTADSVAISNSHNLKPVVKATVTDPATSTSTETPGPATPTETPTPTPTEAPTPTISA